MQNSPNLIILTWSRYEHFSHQILVTFQLILTTIATTATTATATASTTTAITTATTI